MQNPTALAPTQALDSQAVQRIKDTEHLKLLSVFYYISAGFSLLAILFVILHAVVMFGFLGFVSASESDFPPIVFGVFGFFYLMFFLISLGSGLMSFFAARYLVMRKHRLFCFITAGLELLSFPLGTILGVFTFVVLQRRSVAETFES